MNIKFRLTIITLMLILVTGPRATAAEKTYVYRSTTKDVVTTITEKVMKNEDTIVNVMISDNGETNLSVLDLDLATKKWEFYNQEQNTILTAERNNDSITLQGRFEGKEIKKELKIDHRPWFQAWRLSFGQFVLSDEAKLEFWTIRTNDLRECIMVVLREKEETIRLNGVNIEAVKVKVTLNNWMSKFWSVNYWLRKSDGAFLRYKGISGPPGTPMTIMELSEIPSL